MVVILFYYFGKCHRIAGWLNIPFRNRTKFI